MRNKRKTRQGRVAKMSGEKTVTVIVTRSQRHKVYNKIVRISKKYTAHTEDSALKPGDTVEIMETRPISKTKRWRVTNVVRRQVEAVAEV
jgi:small subunit ribosomal protein S17